MHTNAKGIFALGDIANMMNLVFNSPIAPNSSSKPLRRLDRLDKRGHIIARFSFDTRVSTLLELALTFNSDHGLQYSLLSFWKMIPLRFVKVSQADKFHHDLQMFEIVAFVE